MILKKLKLENFRNIKSANLEAGSQLNLFLGENGAGKTSVLEAISVIGRGKSFRTSKVTECIRQDSQLFRVLMELEESRAVKSINDATETKGYRLGFERQKSEWIARLNGQDIKKVSELAHLLPLSVFEPNSQSLVSGSPDSRRKYIDWGLFHVEPEFLSVWRSHDRALKQRNSALRLNAPDRTLNSIEQVYLPAAVELHRLRSKHIDDLNLCWSSMVPRISPALSDLKLDIKQGWKQDESLEENLFKNRGNDRQFGSTRYGVHRDDLRLSINGVKAQHLLSRGQQKISALMLILCQLDLWRRKLTRRPIILLDDLNSELDEAHCLRVLAWLRESELQTWMSAVSWPENLKKEIDPETDGMFHVEHGEISRVV